MRTTLPSTLTSTSGGKVVCSLPFGPSKRTPFESTATLTPLGIVTGNFPIRDTGTPRLHYHTEQISSPPTLAFWASRSTRIPFGVESTCTPKPLRTGAIDLELT